MAVPITRQKSALPGAGQEEEICFRHGGRWRTIVLAEVGKGSNERHGGARQDRGENFGGMKNNQRDEVRYGEGKKAKVYLCRRGGR